MFSLMPLCLDVDVVSRELKQKPIFTKTASITRLREEKVDEDVILDLTPYIKDRSAVTKIDFGVITNFDIVSTWDDSLDDLWDENLDVVSRFETIKVFKTKAKIKMVAKFMPKIVID